MAGLEKMQFRWHSLFTFNWIYFAVISFERTITHCNVAKGFKARAIIENNTISRTAGENISSGFSWNVAVINVTISMLIIFKGETKMGELSTMFIANAWRRFIADFYCFTNERGLKAIIYICLIKINLNGKFATSALFLSLFTFTFFWIWKKKKKKSKATFKVNILSVLDLPGNQTYDLAVVSATFYCLS